MKSINLFFIFLACFFIHFSTIFAQSQPIISKEIPLTYDLLPSIQKLPNGDLITFVFDKREVALSSRITITKYDSLFQEAWQKIYPNYPTLAGEIGNTLVGNKLYFPAVFKDSIVSVGALDLMSGKLDKIDLPTFGLNKKFESKYFTATPNALLFANVKGKSNTITYFDLATQKTKILSNTNFIRADFVDMKADKISGTFGVLLKKPESFWLYMYDNQGNMFFNSNVKPANSGYRLITHHLFVKDQNEQWIIGLFGKKQLKPMGIYISRFSKGQFLGTAYHSFAKTANFNNFLPSEKQNEIKTTAKNRFYSYPYYFSRESLDTEGEQLVYSIDLYDEKASIETSQFLTAIYVLDKSGNILLDNTFNTQMLPDSVANPYRNGVASYPIVLVPQKQALTMTYLKKSHLFFLDAKGQAPLKVTEAIESPFQYDRYVSVKPLSQVRYAGMVSARVVHWYDDVYLLMGILPNGDEYNFKMIKFRRGNTF